MEYDQDKVDEITLALLWLTSFKDPGWCTSMEGAGLGHHGATSLKRRHLRSQEQSQISCLERRGRKAVKGALCETLLAQTLARMSNIRPVAAQTPDKGRVGDDATGTMKHKPPTANYHLRLLAGITKPQLTEDGPIASILNWCASGLRLRF
jgi:hypothetical protein